MTSLTSPMLEKVAKALCCPEGCLGDDKEKYPSWICHRDQPFVLERARAALSALKEVDEGTVEAMRKARAEGHGTANCFTAGILHILNEEGEG